MFLLPIPILRTVFRNKFLDGLRRLYRRNLLDCRGPAAAFGDPAWFEEVAAKLGMSEGAVKSVVHRLRQRYRELLRHEIAQTVAEPGEVDEELRHLFVVLGTR